MIERGKQSVELPVVGRQYRGKHNEPIRVHGISASLFGKPGFLVSFERLDTWEHGPQAMELDRFMEWATDAEQKPLNAFPVYARSK